MPDQVGGAGLRLIGIEAPGPDGGLAAWCTLGPRLIPITENCFVLGGIWDSRDQQSFQCIAESPENAFYLEVGNGRVAPYIFILRIPLPASAQRQG